MTGNANKVNQSNVTEAKRPITAQDLSLVSRKWKMVWTHARFQYLTEQILHVQSLITSLRSDGLVRRRRSKRENFYIIFLLRR